MKKISLETIINFYKKIPELLKTFVKSEGFKIGVIIFSCLFAFVIVFPSFLDTSKLNASEKRGLLVFIDEKKGDCFHCHELGNFMTNYKFSNNGLNLNSINDPGLYAVTRNPEDLGKFKVPALINIKYTAPYMHDGRFKTLREVIDFYDTGFHFHPQTNYYLDPNLKKHFDNSTNKPTPRTWTEQDKQDIINFINGLVDESVNTNQIYSK